MNSKMVTCVDFNGEEHSFMEEEYSFRPSVYGVLINDNQEVLMIKNKGKYCFPGGGVEIGEKIYDALVREVFEETGLRITSGEIVECDDSFFLIPYENKPVHSILMFYHCKFEQGEITTDNFDGAEKEYAEKAEWLKIEDVLGMDNLVFMQTRKILETIKHKV
jgi:8-oxo-dGTP pyrophosphatase MutT (NUDIX family)